MPQRSVANARRGWCARYTREPYTLTHTQFATEVERRESRAQPWRFSRRARVRISAYIGLIQARKGPWSRADGFFIRFSRGGALDVVVFWGSRYSAWTRRRERKRGKRYIICSRPFVFFRRVYLLFVKFLWSAWVSVTVTLDFSQFEWL